MKFMYTNNLKQLKESVHEGIYLLLCQNEDGPFLPRTLQFSGHLTVIYFHNYDLIISNVSILRYPTYVKLQDALCFML